MARAFVAPFVLACDPCYIASQRFLAIGERQKSAPSKREELAAVIHLCGTSPATAFARRGFRVMTGKRCGDHGVAAYLAQINAMKRNFTRLAAEK